MVVVFALFWLFFLCMSLFSSSWHWRCVITDGFSLCMSLFLYCHYYYRCFSRIHILFSFLVCKQFPYLRMFLKPLNPDRLCSTIYYVISIRVPATCFASKTFMVIWWLLLLLWKITAQQTMVNHNQNTDIIDLLKMRISSSININFKLLRTFVVFVFFCFYFIFIASSSYFNSRIDAMAFLKQYFGRRVHSFILFILLTHRHTDIPKLISHDDHQFNDHKIELAVQTYRVLFVG